MSSGLSWQEHLILSRIENELRADRALDRALRTMRAPRARLALLPRAARLGRQIPAVCVAVIVGFAAVVTAMAVQVGSVGAFVFLAAVWAAAAVASGAKYASRRRDGKPGS